MRTVFGRRYLRSIRQDNGSMLLETALCMLAIVPAMLWMLELSMLIYTWNILSNAARQGVRYAEVHGTDSSLCSGPSNGCSDPSAANVVAQVQQYAAMSYHNLSQMNVTVSYPDGSSAPPSRVMVSLQYTYVPYLNLPGIVRNLNVTAEGRIVF